MKREIQKNNHISIQFLVVYIHIIHEEKQKNKKQQIKKENY